MLITPAINWLKKRIFYDINSALAMNIEKTCTGNLNVNKRVTQ
jgi:hypothetical protein